MLLRKNTNNISIKRHSPRARKHSLSLEMAILVIFALVVVYGASFAIKITHGFSKTVETPVQIVRLQILNGCGIGGAAGKIASAVPRLVKLPLEVQLVDYSNFDAYHVRNSFIISRDENLYAGKLLAGQLGLDEALVVYQPLEDNYRSISATLVLGDDYESIICKTTK